MYKKEIERKWLINGNLPILNNYPKIKIKQGYLSQQFDSLTVRVRSENDTNFFVTIKDSGTKIRNEITYNITKEEFDVSYQLAGKKTISKTRYLIPSTSDSNRILELDIFDNIRLMMVEYEDDTIDLVDSLVEEEWFGLEVTDDINYNNQQIAYNNI